MTASSSFSRRPVPLASTTLPVRDLARPLSDNPRGGAIAVLSATAVAFSGANAELNRKFFEALWPQRNPLTQVPIGVATATAKMNMASPASLNNRRYPLLGDPAVVMSLPRLRCVPYCRRVLSRRRRQPRHLVPRIGPMIRGEIHR